MHRIQAYSNNGKTVGDVAGVSKCKVSCEWIFIILKKFMTFNFFIWLLIDGYYMHLQLLYLNSKSKEGIRQLWLVLDKISINCQTTVQWTLEPNDPMINLYT